MTRHSVVHRKAEEYGAGFSGDLLEQYKLTRSAVVNLQDDRNVNNRFILTLCSAIAGVETYFLRQILENVQEETQSPVLIVLAVLPVLGIYISKMWIKMSLSYGIAIKVRYSLLKEMEIYLPSCPFTAEPDLRDHLKYHPVSDIIVTIAKLFLCVFWLLLIFSIIFFLSGSEYFWEIVPRNNFVFSSVVSSNSGELC